MVARSTVGADLKGPSSPPSDHSSDSAVGKPTAAALASKSTYAHRPLGVACASHCLEGTDVPPSPGIACTSRSMIRVADYRSDSTVLSSPTSHRASLVLTARCQLRPDQLRFGRPLGSSSITSVRDPECPQRWCQSFSRDPC